MIPLLNSVVPGQEDQIVLHTIGKMILWGLFPKPTADILEPTVGLKKGQHGNKN